MVDADPVSERALAVLLAEVFADRAFWRELAAAGSAPSPSAVLTERAVEIFLVTGRFLEQDLYLDPQTPAARAAGLLREIADFAAVGSYARHRLAQAGGETPPRSLFEWLVRVDDLDEWASALGHQVSVGDGAKLPDEAWPPTTPEDDESDTDDFLEAWALASGTYGRMLDRFEENSVLREGWADAIAQGGESIEQFRAGCAQTLLGAREWLGWVRRNLPTNAERLAAAGIVMSETLFVLGWRPPEEALVPTPDYLSELLRDSGALDWLTEHGGESPAWLVDA